MKECKITVINYHNYSYQIIDYVISQIKSDLYLINFPFATDKFSSLTIMLT